MFTLNIKCFKWLSMVIKTCSVVYMHTISFVTEGNLKNRHIKLFKRDERDILSEQADQCYTVFKIELNTSLKLLNVFNIKLCLKKRSMKNSCIPWIGIFFNVRLIKKLHDSTSTSWYTLVKCIISLWQSLFLLLTLSKQNVKKLWLLLLSY